MVVPYIKGVQENGVAACVKHYALNNQEFNRHTTNVQLSDRALYEIYLPAFKAAVQEGGTWSIMGSYNLYQGQHACHNKRLLKDILRDEWGFDGVVVSDWEVCTTPNRLFTMAWTWSLVHGRTDCLPEREMRMIIITLLSLT